MKVETYWNYTIESKVQVETCEKGKVIVTEELEDCRKYDINEIGKYSSLESAINGFIIDETNNFSELKIDYFDDDKLKFKITTEVYYDRFGQPINDVIYRKWKRGEYKYITHGFLNVIFIEHVNRQGSINDYSEIMNKFPQIKIM